jgi:hypothetical protein
MINLGSIAVDVDRLHNQSHRKQVTIEPFVSAEPVHMERRFGHGASLPASCGTLVK